jgi:hypothetical protein
MNHIPVDQQPAFPFACQGPTTAPEIYYGITIRDYFAAAALQGLIARPGTVNGKFNSTTNELAVLAYDAADRMMETRNETP